MAIKFESFIFTSGLLLATATAKFISSAGAVPSLQMGDPIFHLSFRQMFIAMGIIETVIGLICFFGKSVKLRAGLLAWLSSAFLVYRIGLNWVGWHKPCSCLGNLTDMLHIPSETVEVVRYLIGVETFFIPFGLKIITNGRNDTRNLFSESVSGAGDSMEYACEKREFAVV